MIVAVMHLAHTNTAEGSSGNLKRQIIGTHHSVSKKHLRATLKRCESDSERLERTARDSRNNQEPGKGGYEDRRTDVPRRGPPPEAPSHDRPQHQRGNERQLDPLRRVNPSQKERRGSSCRCGPRSRRAAGRLRAR